jgi:hypothetical protein
MGPLQENGDELEQLLDTVDPVVKELILQLVADSSYVTPRVVSHVRD